MSLTDDDYRRAKAAGRFAARRGLELKTCPYNETAMGDAGRALALVWVREYLHHRPPPSGAVNYSG